MWKKFHADLLYNYIQDWNRKFMLPFICFKDIHWLRDELCYTIALQYLLFSKSSRREVDRRSGGLQPFCVPSNIDLSFRQLQQSFEHIFQSKHHHHRRGIFSNAFGGLGDLLKCIPHLHLRLNECLARDDNCKTDNDWTILCPLVGSLPSPSVSSPLIGPPISHGLGE